MISGFLTQDTPLRKVFPAGVVPLRNPTAELATLGEGPNPTTENVYLLEVLACQPHELQQLAELLSELGQGKVEEIKAAMMFDGVVPIRVRNITGVGMATRMFT
jgi:hypothetical protein